MLSAIANGLADMIRGLGDLILGRCPLREADLNVRPLADFRIRFMCELKSMRDAQAHISLITELVSLDMIQIGYAWRVVGLKHPDYTPMHDAVLAKDIIDIIAECLWASDRMLALGVPVGMLPEGAETMLLADGWEVHSTFLTRRVFSE